MRAADGSACLGDSLLFIGGLLCQAEVCQLHRAIHRKENIAGLNVAMDQARLPASVFKSAGKIDGDVQSLVFGQSFLPFEPGLQVFTLDVLHRQVVIAIGFAHVVSHDDVGVLQFRH